MTKPTYEQALADHTYLWETYGPAQDMTGGYVDQDDLAKLLRSPTKATARDCLVDQIIYWFSVGPESDCERPDGDPFVEDIADRYNVGFDFRDYR